MTVLYTLRTLPGEAGGTPLADLPWQNKVLAALFVMHYCYRAVLFPFLQPSMAPIHALVWVFAGRVPGVQRHAHRVLARARTGRRRTRRGAGQCGTAQFALGLSLFCWPRRNYYHDDELREIRRRETARRERGRPEGRPRRGRAWPSTTRCPRPDCSRWCCTRTTCASRIEWTRLSGWRAAGAASRSDVRRQRGGGHGAARREGRALVRGEVWQGQDSRPLGGGARGSIGGTSRCILPWTASADGFEMLDAQDCRVRRDRL